jgi:ketosteroid isomerase-like protein
MEGRIKTESIWSVLFSNAIVKQLFDIFVHLIEAQRILDSSGVVRSNQPVMAPMSSTADEAEIRDLLAAYCYYFDNGEADRWSALFTEDCVWEADQLHPAGVPFERFEGRAALANLCRTANANGAKYRHLTLNTVVRVTGDSARANSYVLVVHVNEDGPKLNSARFYDDHLVKHPQGWRIKSRAYRKALGPRDIIA